MESGSSPPPTASAGAGKGGKKRSRGPKKTKPKITKEERRAKYTKIARDRRNANMARARDRHLVCYRCRKTGHSAENCRAAAAPGQGEGEAGCNSNNMPPAKKRGGIICYKCGSIEHRIQACPKIKKYIKKGERIDFGKLGELPFANCYVCNKSGHLSSHCPQSTKGVYPQGGSCRECGSIYHYAKDCPNKSRGDNGNDDDASNASSNSVTIDQYLEEPVDKDQKTEPSPKKKRKVVNF